MIEQEPYIVTAEVLWKKIHESDEQRFRTLSSILVESMPQGGQNRVWKLPKVADKMILTLDSSTPGDFSVERMAPLNEDGKPTSDGAVMEGDPAEWKWRVVPLSSSIDKKSRTLVLTASVFYGDANPITKTVGTYDISVEVNPWYHTLRVVAWVFGIFVAVLAVVLRKKITEILNKLFHVK